MDTKNSPGLDIDDCLLAKRRDKKANQQRDLKIALAREVVTKIAEFGESSVDLYGEIEAKIIEKMEGNEYAAFAAQRRQGQAHMMASLRESATALMAAEIARQEKMADRRQELEMTRLANEHAIVLARLKIEIG
jgi:hypothetical protein